MDNGTKEENERMWRRDIEWHLKQIRELLERILEALEQSEEKVK